MPTFCQKCNKVATFNTEGEKKALYCSEHKKKDMVNVKDKRCLDCKKIPSYNTEGEKKGLYCSKHKKKDMVNVKHKRCLECKKIPSYNTEGEKKALYCSEHMKKDMVNVQNKTCLDCNIRPSYNTEGEKKALYCSKHMKKDMVNVKDKRCLDCTKMAIYNNEGEKPMYCSEHKKKDMVNVKHKRCLDCSKHAIYNNEGEKPMYCSEHKKEDMVDVMNNRCKTYLCSTHVVTNKYEGYCLRCFMQTFPDRPVARNYKTKEFSVVDFVTSKYPDLTWNADKTVQDGCSNKRPDLLLDLGYQIVIVEVDEKQHKNYSCDNKRTMELSKDFNHRPIVFIRFNPDAYKKNGETITSCWGHNKMGICVVEKKEEWSNRLELLRNHIEYWIDPEHKSEKTIETIQLFYSD